MAQQGPKGNEARPPGGPPLEPSTSRRMLLLLPLMLLAMWFWKFSTEGAGQPSVAYSQLFQLVEQGKVESVVFDGEVLGATLAKPEKLDGHESKELHSNWISSEDMAQLLNANVMLAQQGQGTVDGFIAGVGQQGQ